MDGVLVNNTINASIDNANKSGNVHQYFMKNLLIIITISIPICLLLILVRLLAVVSLPCALGNLHVGENSREG